MDFTAMTRRRTPGATPPAGAGRAEARDLVALLRQMERQPEVGRRLLHALELLLERGDPDLCVDLARHYAGRPIRSKADAVRWVRSLHRVLMAANRRH